MGTENEQPVTGAYDVIVVGAGPCGCEAALAAARSGAKTLCLSINLDMVGYPTATPVLVDDRDDRRHALLAEIGRLGAELPQLLAIEGISGTDSVAGRILVDRRLLGLAWKERLESADRLALRQALVTSLTPGLQPADRFTPENTPPTGPATGDTPITGPFPGENGWRLETALGEIFTAQAVVIAAGTFLNGRVIDAGETVPGGRWAEIPSISLAECLQNMDISLVDIWARTSPRLSSHGLGEQMLADTRFRRDGVQLGEILAFTLETDDSRESQLQALRSNEGLDHAWINRPSYSLLHLGLAAEQATTSLEVINRPGLFFAGRAAGGCNYTEAATLGLIAGSNAARRSGHNAMTPDLTISKTLVGILLERIAHKDSRPVTVRIDDESGC